MRFYELPKHLEGYPDAVLDEATIAAGAEWNRAVPALNKLQAELHELDTKAASGTVLPSERKKAGELAEDKLFALADLLQKASVSQEAYVDGAVKARVAASERYRLAAQDWGNDSEADLLAKFGTSHKGLYLTLIQNAPEYLQLKSLESKYMATSQGVGIEPARLNAEAARPVWNRLKADRERQARQDRAVGIVMGRAC